MMSPLKRRTAGVIFCDWEASHNIIFR